MKLEHVQNTEAFNSSAASADRAGCLQRKATSAKHAHSSVGQLQKLEAADNKVGTSSMANQLLSSLTSSTDPEDKGAVSEFGGGRYLGQSPTFKNYCPQRAAEKIYLDLVADLQLHRFNLSKSFRDTFFETFAAAFPTEKCRVATYLVRCQARLGLKVDKSFRVVCLAAASAKAKATRSKTC